MSLALKFSSLAIRTLSKPIANFIKRQAREHEGFRRTCINFAQRLHRIDMRWRIGLLQDAAAVEKQAAREAAQDAAKRHKHNNIPTVKTEAQTKADEEAAAKAAKEATSEPAKPKSQPRIRPLSEAKAIESGANFISETFLFSVAAGLILVESWRSRKKESTRRDGVAERLADLEFSEKAARHALVELEREVLRLRAKESTDKADEAAKAALETNSPGPAEKILVAADEEMAEKHKKRELEAPAPAPALHSERAGSVETIQHEKDECYRQQNQRPSQPVAADMSVVVAKAHNTPNTPNTHILQILVLTITNARAQDCANRLQDFVSAVKPANAVDLVLLVKDALDKLLDLGHVPVVVAYLADQVVPLLEKVVDQL
ncbi:hypothetical protein DV736_g5150, partial [Chaetothyriales sp. CBS 134916]